MNSRRSRTEPPAPGPGEPPGPDGGVPGTAVPGAASDAAGTRGGRRPEAELVREGPPPGVGHLLRYETRVLGQPLAVLVHPERGTATTVVELTPESGELLADVPRQGPRDAAGPAAAATLRLLLDRLSGAGSPFTRLQILISSRPPGRTSRVHLVAALPLTRAVVAAGRAAGERGTRDRSGDGLALIAGRATLDLGRQLADCGLSIRGFLDNAALTGLIRSRYDPGHGQWADAGVPPWPTEVDATHHRRLRTTSAAGAGGRAVSWYHATAWVKAWPSTADGLDLSAPLRLPRLPLPRTSALVLALAPDEVPTAAGYLSVSARTPVELQQFRVDLRRLLPAESPLQLEWTDREHHLAFAHTLPLATGLATAPPTVQDGHF
ncbi:hypothetical protein [Streptacidiphilus sp. P02-A3a]|uniref:hypothetical protein n=1 Tax=Streptacidiphilus sp. P02-A3a TaxID=2704468 RepID=UPI0015FA0438|nr:hypothetical protein [Streptacidiphilus sp. P02-A3a]QMU68882.1 hypothetical protein GXP74_12210 [Streptacidiphilus sp. P02-A3a]